MFGLQTSADSDTPPPAIIQALRVKHRSGSQDVQTKIDMNTKSSPQQIRASTRLAGLFLEPRNQREAIWQRLTLVIRSSKRARVRSAIIALIIFIPASMTRHSERSYPTYRRGTAAHWDWLLRIALAEYLRVVWSPLHLRHSPSLIEETLLYCVPMIVTWLFPRAQYAR